MTGLAGGIIGFLGGLGESVLSFFSKREDNAHKLEMAKLSLEELDKELKRERIVSEGQIKTAEINAQSAAIQGYSERVSESYKHDSKLNGIRGLVRPVLTGALVILLAAVYFTTQDAAIKSTVSGAIVEISIAAVAWWFGGRAGAKVRGKHE